MNQSAWLVTVGSRAGQEGRQKPAVYQGLVFPTCGGAEGVTFRAPPSLPKAPTPDSWPCQGQTVTEGPLMLKTQ